MEDLKRLNYSCTVKHNKLQLGVLEGLNTKVHINFKLVLGELRYLPIKGCKLILGILDIHRVYTKNISNLTRALPPRGLNGISSH